LKKKPLIITVVLSILILIIILGLNNGELVQLRRMENIQYFPSPITTSFAYRITPITSATITNITGTRKCYKPDEPYPTLWINHQGPCGSLSPTFTPVYSPTAPEMYRDIPPLPGGLFIEEYLLDVKGELRTGTTEKGEKYSYMDFNPYNVKNWDEIPDIYERHPNIGGWYFWPKGGELGGKLFLAKEMNHKIIATLDDEIIFSEDCSSGPQAGVITAWTYHMDWMIQSYCSAKEHKYEIIINGEHINESNGYSQSYALQLMNGKPFYLFLKNNKVWLRYENEDAVLGYDGIIIHYCCDGFIPPQHYERAITFYAYIGFNLFQVFIGKE
jgi:hypothetical protein